METICVDADDGEKRELSRAINEIKADDEEGRDGEKML